MSALKETHTNAIKDVPAVKDLSRKNMFEITKPLLRLEKEWQTQQPVLIRQLSTFKFLNHFFIYSYYLYVYFIKKLIIFAFMSHT